MRVLLVLALSALMGALPIQANETANVGAPVACPFTNTSPSDSIAQVRGALRALAGSSDVCNQMISQNAVGLDSLLNSILEERFPTHRINLDGTTPLTCENFEAVLARERQLVLDSKGNQYYVIGPDFLPRYQRCEMFRRPASEINESNLDPEYIGLTQNQRFDICVEKVFQENFYRKVEECEIRGELERENRVNEAYRARITEISQVAQNLITSSQNCSNQDILRNITQSVIPLITTLGTFSFANPVVGVGMAVGGSLASALVDRFFNTNGPNEYIALLEDEEQATNLNCLYYQVQNDVLACGRPNPLEDVTPSPVVQCMVERQDQFLEQIYTLSQQLRRITSVNDPLGQADIADHIRRLLGNELNLPDGTNVPTIDYLGQVSASLKSDPTRTADMITGRRIDRVIEAYNNWQQATQATPVDENAILESNAMMMNAIKGENGQQPLDLVDSMRRFWSRENMSNSATMIGRLRAMESPNQYFSPIPQQSNDITTTRSTRISHDALVHLYQTRFENRLETQYEDFLRNRKPATDSLHHTNLDYLIPLFQNCTLNAGMYHYQRRDGSHHSVNRVSRRPTEKYREVCSMFMCPDGSLVPPFQPSGDDNSLGSQFRTYQCAIKAQYNQLLNRMVTNYRRTGSVCPRPAPAPGGATTPEGQTAAGAYNPPVSPDQQDGGSSGGGFFSWLGSLFEGIVGFFKNLF